LNALKCRTSLINIAAMACAWVDVSGRSLWVCACRLVLRYH
jgi:hypothetical protein